MRGNPSTNEILMGYQRIDTLTGLRFYAALVVVILHVTRYYAPVPVISELFAPGSVGVSFFFILSGFVLAWSKQENLPVSDFYRNRFARVYPLHLVTWVIAAILIVIDGVQLNIWAGIASLLLVQAWVPFQSFYFAMNGPSWSLAAEGFFYAVFPWVSGHMSRASPRRLLHLILALYVAIAAITLVLHILLRGGPTVAFLYVNPAYRLWEFVVGIAIALAVRKGWRVRLRLPVALVATVIAFVLTSVVNFLIVNKIGPVAELEMKSLPADIASLALVPFFGLLIASAVTAELHGHRSHLNSPTMIRLGKWSFALYLVHLLLVQLLLPLTPRDLPWTASTLLAIATIGAAIGIAGLMYRYIEHPLESRLRTPRRRLNPEALHGPEAAGIRGEATIV